MSANVEVGFAPIDTISLEVSIPQAVVVSTTMTGLSVSLGAMNAPVTVSTNQRNDALLQTQVIAACTMTVGSIFTMDLTAPAVVTATFEPAPISVAFSCPVSVGATFPSGELSGGTVNTSLSGAITVSTSFTANTGNAFSPSIVTSAIFAGSRTTHYTTPRERCVNVFNRRFRR
jgi:hypothetical protein